MAPRAGQLRAPPFWGLPPAGDPPHGRLLSGAAHCCALSAYCVQGQGLLHLELLSSQRLSRRSLDADTPHISALQVPGRLPCPVPDRQEIIFVCRWMCQQPRVQPHRQRCTPGRLRPASRLGASACCLPSPPPTLLRYVAPFGASPWQQAWSLRALLEPRESKIVPGAPDVGAAHSCRPLLPCRLC